MKIHHFGYLVGDLERSLETFRALGYEVESQNRNETRGVDICFIRNGEHLLELVCPFRGDSDVSGLLKKHRNMIYHVCYVSEDIQKDVEKLKGFVPVSKITKAPSIGDADVMFLFNNSVGMIELVQLDQQVKENGI